MKLFEKRIKNESKSIWKQLGWKAWTTTDIIYIMIMKDSKQKIIKYVKLILYSHNV